jgi:hypothetical protein
MNRKETEDYIKHNLSTLQKTLYAELTQNITAHNPCQSKVNILALVLP